MMMLPADEITGGGSMKVIFQWLLPVMVPVNAVQ